MIETSCNNLIRYVLFVSTFEILDFFFFQAEDGIRDFQVTGVQTCALPISTGRHSRLCLWHQYGSVIGWRGKSRSKCVVRRADRAARERITLATSHPGSSSDSDATQW